jgi:hypothetical protein
MLTELLGAALEGPPDQDVALVVAGEHMGAAIVDRQGPDRMDGELALARALASA